MAGRVREQMGVSGRQENIVGYHKRQKGGVFSIRVTQCSLFEEARKEGWLTRGDADE